jgi:hypothetical protein
VRRVLAGATFSRSVTPASGAIRCADQCSRITPPTARHQLSLSQSVSTVSLHGGTDAADAIRAREPIGLTERLDVELDGLLFAPASTAAVERREAGSSEQSCVS